MIKPKKTSAHQRVVEDYFHTTSNVGSASDAAAFQNSVNGLRRRLGPWLDVAGKDVIDLGSGTGELCLLARDGGARTIVGVNLSQDEIVFAAQQVEASFVKQDIMDYLKNCESASVDRIYALNILEHLTKDSLVHVLEHANRVLRGRGRLVAMVPNATSPFGGMTRYWDITHHSAFTPSSVHQLARLVGFGDSVEFRECGPVPYALVSTLRYCIWQCIRLVIRGYLLVESGSSKGGIYTADMMFSLEKPPG